MLEAFQKNDVSAIDEFVKVDDPGLKVKSEDIQAYIRYLKDNPSYNKALLYYLQKEAITKDSVGGTVSFEDGRIIEDGKNGSYIRSISSI